ncbi:MAG: hypothetical protein NTX50_09200 [Candidatus Sumerlaeota bacterium]|nr:hypothetical protein [Candidatus Sumerlaeota bacterium]
MADRFSILNRNALVLICCQAEGGGGGEFFLAFALSAALAGVTATNNHAATIKAANAERLCLDFIAIASKYYYTLGM